MSAAVQARGFALGRIWEVQKLLGLDGEHVIPEKLLIRLSSV